MKSLLKNTVICAVGLYVVPFVFDGLQITGGITNYILGAVVLSVLFNLVKPILSALTFPINAITFGMFSFLINALMFYFLTILLPFITVSAFTFPGANIGGFIIPSLYFNAFFSYIVISLAFSTVVSLIRWVLGK